MSTTTQRPQSALAVNRLVPYAHVANVGQSMTFYALLGFAPVNVVRDAHGGGEPYWAMLSSGQAEIMLARASGPIDAGQQAVLFYMYAEDVGALRAHLLASGLADGNSFHGQPGPDGGRGVVFAINRPAYMPAGEMRVHDPDGYVLQIGQLS